MKVDLGFIITVAVTDRRCLNHHICVETQGLTAGEIKFPH